MASKMGQMGQRFGQAENHVCGEVRSIIRLNRAPAMVDCEISPLLIAGTFVNLTLLRLDGC